MRFIDRVRIQVRAGDGGNGAVAWRREAHVPKGGPSGGDGGEGGDVWLVADAQLSTLLELKYRQHHQAENGRGGAGAGKYGRGGEPLEIRVPVGTSVYYEGEATAAGERPPWFDENPDGIRFEPYDEPEPNFDEPEPDLDASDEPEPDEPELEEPEQPEPDPSESDASESEPSESEQGELENVWVVGERMVELDVPDSEVIDEARAELLELGAPPEILAVGETISGSAQRRNMRAHTKQRPNRDQRPRFELGALMYDLDDDGARVLVARGGHGGRGNIHFRSATNRTPDRAEAGTRGEGMWLRLELKLLADVGIVGYPNVGKSTLISSISRARPEIGAYPFTTLTPQLGVVSLPSAPGGVERTMVVADVPGLVDGASEGRGLGHEFLRHLERTRVLLHLLAPDPTPGRELLRDLDALEGELRRYGPMFEGRPRVVALNKIDTDEGRELIQQTRRALRKRNIPLFPISAATGEGTGPLLEALWRRLALVERRAPKLPDDSASHDGDVDDEDSLG
jgi:GTP-binding protein